MVSRRTVTFRFGPISTSTSLLATCLPSLSATMPTFCTTPMMPPPVTTLSPRFSDASMPFISLAFCCCGRISRNQNTAKIMISGKNCDTLPNMALKSWAYAGEMSMNGSLR